MSQESATEPKDLVQLCAMQEQLLQRCLSVIEGFLGPSAPTEFRFRIAQELLDDLHAHVDPDAPPPTDVRLLAMANAELHRQLKEANTENPMATCTPETLCETLRRAIWGEAGDRDQCGIVQLTTVNEATRSIKLLAVGFRDERRDPIIPFKVCPFCGGSLPVYPNR